MMIVTVWNLLGLLLGLVGGLLLLGVYYRVLYPLVSARYEMAKLTAAHKFGPWLVTTVFRIVTLVLVPLLGFFLGAGLRP